MGTNSGTNLFSGLPEVVEHTLGVTKFASKSAALSLSKRGYDAQAATLVPSLFERLNQNWAIATSTKCSRSLENFRWPYPKTDLTKGNPSLEVSLERELIGALVAAHRTEWSNQVPLISGIAGPHAFKRRAVDLVRKHNDDCFEFVELKIDSDTPVSAAIEVLTYALLWLLSRRDRQTLGYLASPILKARSLRLSLRWTVRVAWGITEAVLNADWVKRRRLDLLLCTLC